MLELAFLYSKICKYDRAASFYEQILLANPDNYPIKYEFAKLFELRNDHDKAKKLMCELYEGNYNIEEIAEELFSIFAEDGENEKIIEYFNKHINQIKSTKILYLVAAAYMNLQNNQLANEYLEQAYNTDNNNILAGIQIVQKLIKKEKITEAENLIKQILGINSDNIQALSLNAIIDIKNNKSAKVRPVIKKNRNIARKR